MNCIFRILIVSLFFISCADKKHELASHGTISTSTQEIKIENVDSFKTGVIFSQSCLAKPEQSYAVYLPSSYKKENALPVIYFFDPHAAGSLPLEKYKPLAEEFNFILTGSNNSKNGMPMEESFSIANTMIKDVQQRFYTNAKRAYVAGFSGGARVACSLPFQNVNVAGVIACSGSSGGDGKTFPQDICIVTIAGEKDFNYHEMLRFDKLLDTVVQHQLLISNSKHEWPSDETMHDAFVFLEADAMKKNLILKNNLLITNYLKKGIQKAKRLEETKHFYDALIEFKKLANVSEGLEDNSQIKKELVRLKNTSQVNTHLIKESTLNQLEENTMQQYQQEFTAKDLSWWENEIGNLKKKAKNTNDNLSSAMNERLLGFIGIISYSYCTKAVKMNASETLKFLSIYKVVEPENPESYFLAAVYAANNNNISVAASELKYAIKNGFREKQRFNEFPSLNNVIYQTDVKMMLDTIK